MNARFKEAIRKFLPRSVRPYRILAGPLRGRIIYTSLHDYPGAIRGTTEAELTGWLQENVRPGEVWLDIGAHYGYISLLLSLLTGSCGRVFAFEPMLTTAGYLNLTRQVNRLPQLTILPFALGLKDAPFLFNLPTTRGMADSTLHFAGSIETLIQVSFDRLWEWVDKDNGKVDGVKIDVQGMEREVLLGMEQLLSTHRPVLLVEFHRGVDRSQLSQFLADCGYGMPGSSLPGADAAPAGEYLDNHTYIFLPNHQGTTA